MEFEAFWDSFWEEDILQRYDTLKAVFSEKLPAHIVAEYDVGDVLTEFIGHYEEAKEYSKILEFTDLLATHNPEHLAEVSAYFDEFLIDYFCYQGQAAQLEAPIQRFLANPLENYEFLLKSIQVLIYYGYSDQAEAIINQIYTQVRDSGKLLAGAEGELAMYRFFLGLERVYAHFSEQQVFEWQAFREDLLAFDFEFKEATWANDLELGLGMDLSEVSVTFPAAFQRNRNEASDWLSKCFMVYTRERKLSFATSSDIWYNLFEYWEDRRGSPGLKHFFSLRPSTFKAFLLKKSGFMVDYRFFSVMILWGSTYVYDFLKAAALIDDSTWEKTQQAIQQLKQAIIQEDPDSLWKFSFVHAWGKPDALTQEEWDQEKATFREYHATFADKKTRLSTASFFFPSEAELLEVLKHLEGVNPEEEWSEAPRIQPLAPKVQLPKIGRNERITVRYTDGRLVQDIKFKKVKDDLERGDCVLVD